jgi:hypothetical protein
MSLESDRASLAAAIEAVVDTDKYEVYDKVPDTIQTPCFMIAPADPYLAIPESGTFAPGEFVVSFNVYVLVELGGSNETASDDLDDALSQIVSNLGEWLLTAVGAPDTYSTSEWLAYGSRLTVQNLTTIEGTPAP